MQIVELKIWKDQKPTQEFVLTIGEIVPAPMPRNGYSPAYGAKLPSSEMVLFRGRMRRVYVANYGNSGTLYLGKPGQWQATVESFAALPPEFESFHHAYITAMLWAETDEKEMPLESRFGPDDLALEFKTKALSDCLKFWRQNSALILSEAAPMVEYYDGSTEPERKAAQAGNDFYFTRQGHGVGFWEPEWQEADPSGILDKAAKCFGEFWPYVYRGKVHC